MDMQSDNHKVMPFFFLTKLLEISTFSALDAR